MCGSAVPTPPWQVSLKHSAYLAPGWRSPASSPAPFRPLPFRSPEEDPHSGRGLGRWGLSACPWPGLGTRGLGNFLWGARGGGAPDGSWRTPPPASAHLGAPPAGPPPISRPLPGSSGRGRPARLGHRARRTHSRRLGSHHLARWTLWPRSPWAPLSDSSH